MTKETVKEIGKLGLDLSKITFAISGIMLINKETKEDE